VPETTVPTDALGAIVTVIVTAWPAGTRAGSRDPPVVSASTVSGTDDVTEGSNASVVACTAVVSTTLGSPVAYGPISAWKTFHSPAESPPGGA